MLFNENKAEKLQHADETERDLISPIIFFFRSAWLSLTDRNMGDGSNLDFILLEHHLNKGVTLQYLELWIMNPVIIFYESTPWGTCCQQ